MKDETMSEDTLSQSKFRDPQSEIRVGVVICGCGGQIAGRLDIESVRRQTAALPGVVYAARDAYPCSKDGQARLRQAIVDHELDRVLIAACTPRLVEKLFQRAAQETGLDGDCLGIADIREQCAYVHAGDAKAAAQKAADLIEIGVARLAATTRFASPPHTGRVVGSAMLIGSGLGGLTAALALADNGIDVTLVERASTLDGVQPDHDERARELIARRIEAVSCHPHIRTLLTARVTDVTGRPGDYEVRITQGAQTTACAIGAIVVTADARPKSLGTGRWYDRSRVVTQAEFEAELDLAEDASSNVPHDIAMILCAEEAKANRCSRVCCMTGIRQAVRAKQRNPDANVTILFRDLYLGGAGDLHADGLQKARDLGVTFFRYQRDRPPVIGDKTVDVHDALTGEALHLPFDRVVLSMPLDPPDYANTLAALLRVPQDDAGFMVEPRVRLQPGRYADDGIHVLGGAHQPVDTAEALFQAYVTSSRVMRFLSQKTIQVEAPVVDVNAALCTGCGNCVPVCPTAAITLQKRESMLSLASVEALRCTGCGNCAVACPVKAITLPGWEDAVILAQISAACAKRVPAETRVVALACEWSAYAAADMAGVRPASGAQSVYPAEVRIIRMPCSARFDPDHILWAFLNGADGVFLGACPPGECHYGTGNRYAKDRVEALKKQFVERGIDPRRLCLEFLPGDDGERFAQAITDFTEVVKQ
jgi:heterodisulfide reductase subunit A